jgi:hypothetical protein
MAPFSGIHSLSTLSDFVYPTRCSTHLHSTKTDPRGSRPENTSLDEAIPKMTHKAGTTSYQAQTTSLDETIPKMTHKAGTTTHQAQTIASQTQSQTRANTLRSVPGQVIKPTETQHAAASGRPSITSVPSTTSTSTHSSAPSNSLLGDSNGPSTTSVPDLTSPALTDHISTKIGFAFLGAVLLIAAGLCVFFFGLPKYQKYQLTRRTRKETQVVQRQWWVWIKVDREKPRFATLGRGIELPEVQQTTRISTSSSAVLQEDAAMSPLPASRPTTGESWPLRSRLVSTAPVGRSLPGSMSSPVSGSGPSSTQHDRMRSWETYRTDFSQLYARSDVPSDPRRSPTVIIGVESAKVVRMRSASPDKVKITKSGVRPVSLVASIGGDTDDGFEEVNLA